MTKIIRSLNRIALNANRTRRTSTPILKVFTKTECLAASSRFFLAHSYSTSNNSELDFSVDRKVVSQSNALGKDVDEEIDPFAACQDFAVSNDEWSTSFYGVGSKPFDKEVIDILLAPVDPEDIEIKPDGLLYLPEIKYRRILNRAFGPGGWGIIPRGPTTVTPKNLSREYALICDGRFVSQARGEQDYFDRNDISVAAEGAKSNALTRCCKDLGIASELWDPSFVRKFKSANCEQAWVEHIPSKKRRQLWHLKNVPFEYPYRAT